MLKKLLTAILLITSLESKADWTSQEQQWFIASNIAIAADWTTTRYGSRHPELGRQESNLILGRHPSTDQVDTYFAIQLILNYLITDWLPHEYRSFYLGARTVVHGGAAINNMELGWRLQF